MFRSKTPTITLKNLERDTPYPPYTIELAPLDLYHLLREQVKHEDDLVNQRYNWLLLLQGFLFVAYTSLLAPQTPIVPLARYFVMLIVAAFSILMTDSLHFGIKRAEESLNNLRLIAQQYGLFPITNGNWNLQKGVTSPSGLPPLVWFPGKVETHLTVYIQRIWWLLLAISAALLLTVPFPLPADGQFWARLFAALQASLAP